MTSATTYTRSEIRVRELESELQSLADTKNKQIWELEVMLAAEVEARQALQKTLEETNHFQWSKVLEEFQQELDALYQNQGPFRDGPGTAELMKSFTLSLLEKQLANHAPHLHSIASFLDFPSSESVQRQAIRRIQGITALSILAKRRSPKMKGLQLLISLINDGGKSCEQASDCQFQSSWCLSKLLLVSDLGVGEETS